MFSMLALTFLVLGTAGTTQAQINYPNSKYCPSDPPSTFTMNAPTAYALTGYVHCSMPDSRYDTTHYAALATQDYENGLACGACAVMNNGGNSTTVVIVDECPSSSNPPCVNGTHHLDISAQAYGELLGQPGCMHYNGTNVQNNGCNAPPGSVTWHFIQCPLSLMPGSGGNISYVFKQSGSPTNYQQVSFIDSFFPIVSVLVSVNGGGWTTLARDTTAGGDNFWTNAGSNWGGGATNPSLSFALTDARGNAVTLSGITGYTPMEPTGTGGYPVTEGGTPSSWAYGSTSVQFPGCVIGPTNTPTKTNTPGSPTATPTNSPTLTFTFTPTPLVGCPNVNYNGEGAPTNLAMGNTWAAPAGSIVESAAAAHSGANGMQWNMSWGAGAGYWEMGWNWDASWIPNGRAINLAGYSGLTFWIKTTAGSYTPAIINLVDTANVKSNAVTITTTYLPSGVTTTWQQVTVPLSAFTFPGGFNQASVWEMDFEIFPGAAAGSGTMYFDDFALIGPCPTNTFTPTNTSTFTSTSTPTFTRTFTNSPTLTNTFTRTFTPTITNTFTSTFSPTNTPTKTFTPTFSNTFTSTSTFTPAPPTNTFTNTGTPTYSFTPTLTYTRTFSPTPSNTFTPAPPTNTFTSTATSTNSFTPTQTFTRTFSPTPSNTFTQTNSPTFTNTSTNTYSPTITFTPSWTFTGTLSPSATFTNTFSPTVTPTSTFTSTNTFTSSNTFTSTYTPTISNTPTWTMTGTTSPTATSTWTFTWTRTSTLTPTVTATPTSTWTPTVTPTWTYTGTSTFTPTLTPTPVTVTVTGGPNPPPNATLLAGASNVPVGQMVLNNPGNAPVTLTDLNLNISGTGNPASGITGMTLSNNGTPFASTTPGGPNVSFSGFALVIPPGGSVTLQANATFALAGPAGNYQFNVTGGAATNGQPANFNIGPYPNVTITIIMPTPTFTYTPTITFTPTNTRTNSFTPTISYTPSNTRTLSPTPTSTEPFQDEFHVDKNLFNPSVDKVLSISVVYNKFPGAYSLKVYNSAGEYIQTMDDQPLNGPINHTYLWDGKNKNGDAVASGVYIIYLVEPFDRKIKRVLVIR